MATIRRICAFLILTCSLAPGQAGLLRPNAKFIFNIDYNIFRYNDTSSVVEVGFAVYPGLVSLTQSSSGFHGAVEVRIAISNAARGELVAMDRMILPLDLVDTTSGSLHTLRVGKSLFVLPAETYKLEATAFDSLAPERLDSVMTYFEVKPKSASTSASDLELCTSITSSNDVADPFYKNTYKVIDNPSRVFSTVSSPVVYTYIELYDLKLGTTYILKTQVVDGSGTVVRERSRQRQFTLKDGADVTTVNVNTVAAGKYRLVFTLSDTSGMTVASAEKAFFVYNPATKTESASTIPVSVVLAGLSTEELQAEFDRAKYLMRPDDIKSFQPLTTADARRRFLTKFWADVESGSRGVGEITRRSYLQRVAKANEAYRTMTREGWKTDRGRVYIVYGEPEEIERYPDSEGRKPFEIWHYRNIEGGVDFVFVDRWKNGNYELVTSTKRGELQDPNWESLLH